MPDASGTPSTNYSIPKYNTSVDPPSGKGLNTVVDFVDNLLKTKFTEKPSGIVANEVPVWDGANWVRSSTSSVRISNGGSALPKITTSTLAGGPPASPSDGDIWIATAVDSNGTRWQFQYNAGSASAYKWEFIGGSDVFSSIDTDETTTSTVFADLATVGPSFTIPRAGDYVVVAGAGGYVSAFVTSFTVFVAASSAANVAHAGEYDGNVGSQLRTMQSRPVISTGLAASQVVKAQYAVGASSTTGHLRDRWLTVRPVRIS